jgi:hypothetical protein
MSTHCSEKKNLEMHATFMQMKHLIFASMPLKLPCTKNPNK